MKRMIIILLVAILMNTTFAQYSTNFLINEGAENEYLGWIKTDAGSGWSTGYQSPRTGLKCWSSSYNWCTLQQSVNLSDHYSDGELDSQPDIKIEVFVSTRYDHQGNYEVIAELLNSGDGVVTSWTTGENILSAGSGWIQITKTFSAYGLGVRKVKLTLRGEDGPADWGGSYGAAFDDATVQVDESTLPVELTTFSASVIGAKVKLSWNTATEINNFGFEVERKILKQVQNDNWEKIGFVNGNGNSNSPKEYSFVDNKLSTGKYSYRLKQIDNDGQFEYSKTIEVDFGTPDKFELSQNYPNPFNPSTIIKFNLPEAGMVKLTLYNILGQQIKTLVNEFRESGIYSINFDASELNSGIYIYKIESGSFTQSRKMTLIK